MHLPTGWRPFCEGSPLLLDLSLSILGLLDFAQHSWVAGHMPHRKELGSFVDVKAGSCGRGEREGHPPFSTALSGATVLFTLVASFRHERTGTSTPNFCDLRVGRAPVGDTTRLSMR